MTEIEKSKVAELRQQGLGYKKIGKLLDVSPDTVKSYCRRMGNKSAEMPRQVGSECLCCGTPLVHTPGKKQKKFCSDQCRNKWWNSHLDQVNRKATHTMTCQNCDKPFSVYGSVTRKYCCHDCYIQDRFGGHQT